MKKVLKQDEISDSIISKIPILTIALFWSASYRSGCSQNRDLSEISIFILFKYFFTIPIFSFEINNFLIYLVSNRMECFSYKGGCGVPIWIVPSSHVVLLYYYCCHCIITRAVYNTCSAWFLDCRICQLVFQEVKAY